jgi:tetratricopeptide (TPR) repeat protein
MLNEHSNRSSAAIAQAASMADRKAEADNLFEQGIQQFVLSRFREALQSWQQALEIYRAIGDRAGEGAALNNLGNAYRNLGQYQRAIALYHYSQQIICIPQRLQF